MAASAKKVFEIFVSRVPWTVASRLTKSSFCMVYSVKTFHVSVEILSHPEEMKEYFGQFGSVKKCMLPFDKETGFHRGFCWIGFTTEEGLNNALQKEPHLLEGAKLHVQRNKRPFAGHRSKRDNDND